MGLPVVNTTRSPKRKCETTEGVAGATSKAAKICDEDSEMLDAVNATYDENDSTEEPPYERNADPRIPKHFSCKYWRQLGGEEPSGDIYEQYYDFTEKVVRPWTETKGFTCCLSLHQVESCPCVLHGCHRIGDVQDRPYFWVMDLEEVDRSRWRELHEGLRNEIRLSFADHAALAEAPIRYFCFEESTWPGYLSP